MVFVFIFPNLIKYKTDYKIVSVWLQDHNGFTYRAPGFPDIVVSIKEDIVRINCQTMPIVHS